MKRAYFDRSAMMSCVLKDGEMPCDCWNPGPATAVGEGMLASRCIACGVILMSSDAPQHTSETVDDFSELAAEMLQAMVEHCDKPSGEVACILADIAVQFSDARINTPHTVDFIEAVKIEVVHQRERWGVDHDAGKESQDWFWLLGYLSGKALQAAIDGDLGKAKHHTISSAALLLNWHAALSGVDQRMRPGMRLSSEDTDD